MSKEKMTGAEWFQDLGERLSKDGRLQIDRAKMELSEKIFALMQDKEITEAELARRLGSSRAYVNKVLQGSTNFTVESLVKIGLAIGCDLSIEFIEDQAGTKHNEAHVKYVVEEPIAEPLVVSATSGKSHNVLSFSDYKTSKTIKYVTGIAEEKDNATIENAA